MKIRKATGCIAVLAIALAASAAYPQEVRLVDYAELERELVGRIDFEDFSRVPSPGNVLDGIAVFEGARIGERFDGQLVAQNGGFDVLHLAPERPLRLQSGLAGQNLAVEFVFFMSNQLKGMVPPGFPERDAGGEGAVAILFDRD